MKIPNDAKYITQEYLDRVKNNYINKGFDPPKWVYFCEVMLKHKFKVWLYEAKTTVSKYIYIVRADLALKVRFSNHKPNHTKEYFNDCDIYVGVGNRGVCTTEQVIDFILKS